MKKEFFILDVLSVVLGGKVPGSTEDGVRFVLETCAGRELTRAEWVGTAERVRHQFTTLNPDLLGVPLPDQTDGRLVREWKKAIFHHFGISFIFPVT